MTEPSPVSRIAVIVTYADGNTTAFRAEEPVRAEVEITGLRPKMPAIPLELAVPFAILAPKVPGLRVEFKAHPRHPIVMEHVSKALLPGLSEIMGEDSDDRAIRLAHGFTAEDDFEDRSLLCRNGCGASYYDIAVGKIRECRSARPQSAS